MAKLAVTRPAAGQSHPPRVKRPFFDGPAAVTVIEVVADSGGSSASDELCTEYEEDGTRARHFFHDGEYTDLYLPNVRRQAALVIRDDADSLVDNEGTLYVHSDEYPLPGVMLHVHFDAVGQPLGYVTPDPFNESYPWGAQGNNVFACPTYGHDDHTLRLGIGQNLFIDKSTHATSNPLAALVTGDNAETDQAAEGEDQCDTGECCFRQHAPNESYDIALIDTPTGAGFNGHGGNLYDYPTGITFCGEDDGVTIGDIIRTGLSGWGWWWDPGGVSKYKIAKACAPVVQAIGDGIDNRKARWGGIMERVAAGTATDADIKELKELAADVGHGVLDLIGMLNIPGISAAADGLNALWYAAEGNAIDALFSAIGALPLIGDALLIAWKSTKALLAAAQTAVEAFKIAQSFFDTIRQAVVDLFKFMGSCAQGKVYAMIGAAFGAIIASIQKVFKLENLTYVLGKNDEVWFGTGKGVKEAIEAAFAKTGLPRSEFEITKWGRSADGKSFPVEWRHKSGAEVSVDFPHSTHGPDAPHVGWQTGGKRGAGGAERGHILLDEVPYGRGG